MKKKLEAELISIAHRILKLKNKSELDQLYLETQKLYEKLAVLKFVEENFSDAKPTIGFAAAESILESAFEKQESDETQSTTQEMPSEEVVAEGQNEIEQVIAEEKPQPDKDDKNDKDDDKEDDKDDVAEEKKIQEPEKPEEEKLAPDATPLEKEADEVIAEAEEAVSGNENESEINAEPKEAPVTEAGIDFEQPEAQEEIAAAAPEEPKQDDLFKPSFEWAFDEKAEEKTDDATDNRPQSNQVIFEDLLGAGYKDPVFVKPEDETRNGAMRNAEVETDIPAENNWIEPTRTAEQAAQDVIPITRREDKVPVFKMSSEGTSINDRMSKGITVGLNDRIAFVKHLFNNSTEDYNRVLSQLMTFDRLDEAQDFIDNMVKPDYNNWEGKDEFAQRFMEVVEKKFS